MPIYEYVCEFCGKHTETIQKVDEYVPEIFQRPPKGPGIAIYHELCCDRIWKRSMTIYKVENDPWTDND